VQRKRTPKISLIVGSILILLAGVFAYQLLVAAQNNVDIVVPAKDLAAYSFIDSGDLTTLGVPQGSVTDNDLTASEFEDQFNGEAVITSPILQDQRIDKRSIASGDNASFAVVLPDERVVAVNSTVSGAAVGTIQAGDVVDVTTTGSGLSSAATASGYDKVLCIGTQPSDCQGILPPGVKLNVDSESDNESAAAGDSPVTVLLAVPANDASLISGQSVNLSLNPFCRVDAEGYFYSPRKDSGLDFRCKAPSDRLAARGPQSDETEDFNNSADADTTTGG